MHGSWAPMNHIQDYDFRGLVAPARVLVPEILGSPGRERYLVWEFRDR